MNGTKYARPLPKDLIREKKRLNNIKFVVGLVLSNLLTFSLFCGPSSEDEPIQPNAPEKPNKIIHPKHLRISLPGEIYFRSQDVNQTREFPVTLVDHRGRRLVDKAYVHQVHGPSRISMTSDRQSLVDLEIPNHSLDQLLSSQVRVLKIFPYSKNISHHPKTRKVRYEIRF